jgi:hypothetical protein
MSMMPKCIVGLVVLIAMLTSGRFAFAQEFSAIQVSRDTPGHLTKSKVYMSGKKLSSYAEEDNGQIWGFIDLAKHTFTLINVGKKTYTQRPMARQDPWWLFVSTLDDGSPCPPAVLKELGEGATCKDQGSETLNGRNTEKWEISQPNQRLGTQQPQTVLTRVWVDRKLLVWTKTELMAGATMVGSMELQGIQEGPQPASLFVIPAGFRESPNGF